jgi:hypothetical protein
VMITMQNNDPLEGIYLGRDNLPAQTSQTIRRSFSFGYFFIFLLGIFGGFGMPLHLSAQGTWSSLVHIAPEGINTTLLLSDGTLMAAGSGSAMNTWYRLTPDSAGSYVNGTWSILASMNDSRLYFSSEVLTNGRVFVAGAEYGLGTNSAELYDPLSNTWTRCPPPPAGQSEFYDSVSKILPNGNVLIAPVFAATSGGTVIYVAASNVFVVGPTLFRGSYQDEASWVKLPDDSILTIDPFGTQSERYIPSLNRWVNDSTVPVSLYDSFGSELGAAFLLPDGRAFFLGATGNTALYTPSGTTNAGTWAAGPVIPNNQGTPDAPAAMMVNGKILCAVSPVPVSTNHFPSPTSFYEYDPAGNVFTQVSGPTGTTYPGSTYVMRMLDLPDGNVLLATGGSQLYVYHPSGAALTAGKPAISNVTQNADQSFHITGTLFNGISEGAAYGDDVQMDSNYPLVRMVDSNGVVYYARTYGWNSTSVMTSNRLVASEFSLPANLPATNFSLVVIANGNSSDPFSFSTANLLPVIVTQPKDLTAVAGTTATFSIAAAGTPLQYAWQRNGVPIAGATASSYSTNNVQMSDSGDVFSCVVSNVNGATLSSNAVLTVVPGFPPTITVQPASSTVPVGGLATVSVTATSTAAISYFWQRNGNLIAGATSSSYSTNNVQLSDSGTTFRCIVSNVFGTTLSSNATLTVVTGPSNDLCSAAFVVTNNNYSNAQSTSFATSSGDPSPSCVSSFGKGVWYVFTAPANGVVIADTIGSGFDTGLGVYSGTCGSLSLVTCNDDGGGNLTSKTTNSVVTGSSYYYLAGGYSGASGSLIFHLNFTPASGPPSITSQPASQTVPPGGNATFTLGATGSAPLAYFWKRNGSLIPGATTSAYTTNNVQLADSGAQFSCLVSNNLGTNLSANAVLTVGNATIQNGGFEAGNFSFWTTSGNFASCSVVSSPTYIHSGNFGAQLGPSGSLGFLSQSVPTIPGQFYLISCWVNSDGETPSEFLVSWNGGTLFDKVNNTSSGWSQVKLIAPATTSSTVLEIGFRDDPGYIGLDEVVVTPITLPVMQAILQGNGSLTLAWNTQPGLIYQPQYATNLLSPTWINLGSPLSASGTTLSIPDSTAPDPSRFYRVIVQAQTPVSK